MCGLREEDFNANRTAIDELLAENPLQREILLACKIITLIGQIKTYLLKTRRS